MPSMPDVTAILLAMLVSIAAVFDAWTRRIPNWLTFSALAVAFGVAHWQGRLWSAAAGTGVSLAIYLPLFAWRAMGGGDVKLMAAIGALAGPSAWLRMFVLTALFGGVLALLLVLKKGIARQVFRNIIFILQELGHGRLPSSKRPELSVTSTGSISLPHAVSIALGVLSYLLMERNAGSC